MLIIAGWLASISYTIKLILKPDREFIDWAKWFFVVFFFARPHNLLTNSLPFQGEIRLSISVMTLILFLYIFMQDTSSIFPTNTNRFNQGLFAMSGFSVVIGGLFKIMHWPGAGMFLILGLSLSALWICLSPFFGGAAIPKNETSSDEPLDQHLVSESNSEPLSNLEKVIATVSFILMAIGVILFFTGNHLALYSVLAGFIGGGVFLLLTFRR